MSVNNIVFFIDFFSQRKEQSGLSESIQKMRKREID